MTFLDHIAPMQKQPLEVFYNKKAVHRSSPSGLQFYLKKTPTQGFSFNYCEIPKNIYFEKHLQMAAPAYEIKDKHKNNFMRKPYFFVFRKLL